MSVAKNIYFRDKYTEVQSFGFIASASSGSEVRCQALRGGALSASEVADNEATLCKFGKKEGKVPLKRGRKSRARRKKKGGGVKERRGKKARGTGGQAFELLN